MEVIALEAGSEPLANDYEGRVTGQGYRFQIEVLWPNGRECGLVCREAWGNLTIPAEP